MSHVLLDAYFDGIEDMHRYQYYYRTYHHARWYTVLSEKVNDWESTCQMRHLDESRFQKKKSRSKHHASLQDFPGIISNSRKNRNCQFHCKTRSFNSDFYKAVTLFLMKWAHQWMKIIVIPGSLTFKTLKSYSTLIFVIKEQPWSLHNFHHISPSIASGKTFNGNQMLNPNSTHLCKLLRFISIKMKKMHKRILFFQFKCTRAHHDSCCPSNGEKKLFRPQKRRIWGPAKFSPARKEWRKTWHDTVRKCLWGLGTSPTVARNYLRQTVFEIMLAAAIAGYSQISQHLVKYTGNYANGLANLPHNKLAPYVWELCFLRGNKAVIRRRLFSVTTHEPFRFLLLLADI